MRNLFLIILVAMIGLVILLVVRTSSNAIYQKKPAKTIADSNSVVNRVKLDTLLSRTDSLKGAKPKVLVVAPDKSIVVTATIIAEEQVRAVKLEADKKVIAVQKAESKKRQRLYAQINDMAKQLDSLRKRK